MSMNEPHWRRVLMERLEERNRREIDSYKDIVNSQNSLLESTSQVRAENLRLSIENEKLQTALIDGDGSYTSGTSSISTQKISHLEKKLLTQQEELTDLHKRKGENSQMIVDLNIKLERLNKDLTEKENRLAEEISINTSLKAEVQMLSSSLHELKGLNTMLRDEHTALQLAFASLEEKLRKVQEENRTLVERIIQNKEKDADSLNEENESFLKRRSDKMRRDLEEAARESRSSSSPVSLVPEKGEAAGSITDLSTAPIKMIGFCSDSLPTTVHLKFEAHDGEVNAVRWSPIERLVATGGADRKVRLWDVGKSLLEPRGVLVGSNAGVNSVDFDSTGTLILGTSNDFATRVWTVGDQRLRHTLTGHSGKVMAAKFLGEPSKVVTGSHDRTLKIWDLRSRACVETKFAGSSCNDLVTTDSSGSTIISGHFDKKIRFWDTRTDCSANDILLNGKITSLDLSKDRNYLLICVRDDTIKLLDLRMNLIIGTFTNDDFKVGCDWARVAFSSDASRISAGSVDGTIFIWHISGRLETSLKDNTAPVTAVSWHAFSSALATVDRAKKCTIWVDA